MKAQTQMERSDIPHRSLQSRESVGIQVQVQGSLSGLRTEDRLLLRRIRASCGLNNIFTPQAVILHKNCRLRTNRYVRKSPTIHRRQAERLDYFHHYSRPVAFTMLSPIHDTGSARGRSVTGYCNPL